MRRAFTVQLSASEGRGLRHVLNLARGDIDCAEPAEKKRYAEAEEAMAVLEQLWREHRDQTEDVA